MHYAVSVHARIKLVSFSNSNGDNSLSIVIQAVKFYKNYFIFKLFLSGYPTVKLDKNRICSSLKVMYYVG